MLVVFRGLLGQIVLLLVVFMCCQNLQASDQPKCIKCGEIAKWNAMTRQFYCPECGDEDESDTDDSNYETSEISAQSKEQETQPGRAAELVVAQVTPADTERVELFGLREQIAQLELERREQRAILRDLDNQPPPPPQVHEQPAPQAAALVQAAPVVPTNVERLQQQLDSNLIIQGIAAILQSLGGDLNYVGDNGYGNNSMNTILSASAPSSRLMAAHHIQPAAADEPILPLLQSGALVALQMSDGEGSFQVIFVSYDQVADIVQLHTGSGVSSSELTMSQFNILLENLPSVEVSHQVFSTSTLHPMVMQLVHSLTSVSAEVLPMNINTPGAVQDAEQGSDYEFLVTMMTLAGFQQQQGVAAGNLNELVTQSTALIVQVNQASHHLALYIDRKDDDNVWVYLRRQRVLLSIGHACKLLESLMNNSQLFLRFFSSVSPMEAVL